MAYMQLVLWSERSVRVSSSSAHPSETLHILPTLAPSCNFELPSTRHWTRAAAQELELDAIQSNPDHFSRVQEPFIRVSVTTFDMHLLKSAIGKCQTDICESGIRTRISLAVSRKADIIYVDGELQ